MARPLNLSRDPFAAPASQPAEAPAATTSPTAPRPPKRSAAAVGTSSGSLKRLKSDSSPGARLGAPPVGQPAHPGAVHGSTRDGPAQRPAHAASSTMPLHRSPTADGNNGFAMGYAMSAGQELGAYPATYGVAWAQMPNGSNYDAAFAGSIAQQPFAHPQPSYDSHFGPQQASTYNEPYSAPTSNASPMSVNNLPGLDSLSSRILATLGQQPFQDTLNAVTKVDTPPGQAYASLKGLFEQHFKQYSQRRPFIDAKELHLDNQPYVDMVRKSNLAAFVSSIFGGQEVTLRTLNEHFLDIFVQPGSKLLKWQGGLLLELKTQAYIDAVMKGGKRQEVVDALFPTDLEERLLARRPEPKQLSSSEQEFANCVSQRRQYLLADPDTPEARIQLPRKYDWIEFLKEVNSCISKIQDSYNAPSSRRHSSQSSTYSSSNYAHNTSPGGYFPQVQDPAGGNYDETITRAALMAHAALHGRQPTNSPDTPQNSLNFYQAYPQVAQQHQPSYPANKAPTPPNSIPIQSAPTQVLYDRARSASTVRAPPNSRKPGAVNQRRPWSIEEERALMDGLDRVKGPHWSQILALYGPGGTLSEILKDRNQVQLKDKARNLKLFFLKSGVEVPVYLQGVTGDLKTRAPAQAAKQEALAKQKMEEAEGARREQRAQMDAAAVLAAGARWPGPAGEGFAQIGFAPGQPSIDPSLRGGEDPEMT